MAAGLVIVPRGSGDRELSPGWYFDVEKGCLLKIARDGWADVVDYPVLYDCGRVAFDTPELIPNGIRYDLQHFLRGLSRVD